MLLRLMSRQRLERRRPPPRAAIMAATRSDPAQSFKRASTASLCCSAWRRARLVKRRRRRPVRIGCSEGGGVDKVSFFRRLCCLCRLLNVLLNRLPLPPHKMRKPASSCGQSRTLTVCSRSVLIQPASMSFPCRATPPSRLVGRGVWLLSLFFATPLPFSSSAAMLLSLSTLPPPPPPALPPNPSAGVGCPPRPLCCQRRVSDDGAPVGLLHHRRLVSAPCCLCRRYQREPLCAPQHPAGRLCRPPRRVRTLVCLP